MKRLASLLALAPVLLLLAACASGPLQGASQRESWAVKNIKSYEYVLQRTCFCLGPWKARITVENGKVTKFVDPMTGEAIEPPFSTDWPTIEELFDTIIAAERDGADKLEVTYDPQYAIPLQVHIDRYLNAADDEITFSVSEFKPL